MSVPGVLVAHRAANAPDTLRAAQGHVDVVEADVHLFRGRLEVRHGKTIGPLPILWERWYLLPRDTPRPLLADLLAAAAPLPTDLMLDLKGPDPRMPGALGRALAGWAGERRVIVCSRIWRTVDRLRATRRRARAALGGQPARAAGARPPVPARRARGRVGGPPPAEPGGGGGPAGAGRPRVGLDRRRSGAGGAPRADGASPGSSATSPATSAPPSTGFTRSPPRCNPGSAGRCQPGVRAITRAGRAPRGRAHRPPPALAGVDRHRELVPQPGGAARVVHRAGVRLRHGQAARHGPRDADRPQHDLRGARDRPPPGRADRGRGDGGLSRGSRAGARARVGGRRAAVGRHGPSARQPVRAARLHRRGRAAVRPGASPPPRRGRPDGRPRRALPAAVPAVGGAQRVAAGGDQPGGRADRGLGAPRPARPPGRQARHRPARARRRRPSPAAATTTAPSTSA